MSLPFDCDPRKDPQEEEPESLGYCTCGCGEEIYYGDKDVRRYDGDYFVNAEHHSDWVGAERMDHLW